MPLNCTFTQFDLNVEGAMVYQTIRFFEVKKTNVGSSLFFKPAGGRFSALRRFFIINRLGLGRNRKDRWVTIFFQRIASGTCNTPGI